MAHVIGEACIDVMHTACVEVCPVEAIHYEEGVDRKLYIDPEECIECGACEYACPVSACFAEEDLPEGQEAFAEIDALWYRDKEAARQKVNAFKAAAETPSSASPASSDPAGSGALPY